MKIIKLQFGSKFVVKIPRGGKGKCSNAAPMPKFPPSLHVQTLTALGLTSQRTDYYGY